jgi:FkbM family methyltransferase
VDKVTFAHGNEFVTLYFPKNDHMWSYVTRAKNFYEADLLMKIKEIAPEDATVIDVGGYIGNHAVFFALHFGIVHTFEPNRNMHECLEENLREFPNAMIHKCALGSEEGVGDFKIVNLQEQYLSHVDFNPGMMVDIPVQVDILDNYDIDPDVIKIDVEGAEIDVLKGGHEMIMESKPELFVECRTDEDYKNMFEYLEPLGYCPLDHYAYTPVWHFYHPDREGRRLNE